ncbi:beta carbonic anhydrase 2 [Carex littledalei]|uniref:Carbonic anhydrase n=1 Tax=Carex littledalei TaxID=544730 RepID=A0A833VVJ2_9POAL|nr:beta carbonic anhydrase 2 [Carex littledalei]
MTKKELSALEQLKYGFDHFKKEVYEKDIKRFEQLAEEQKPKFMVIACADSRVCPSTVFSFQPGEAFTVRNIAALVPPFCEKKRNSGVGAALEYAIEILKVENIVVVGHSRCGGIRGLMSISEDSHNCDDFIEDWVKIGWSARERVKDEHGTLPLSDQCSNCEKEAVNLSLNNLKTYPFVKKAIEKNSVKLIGGHYDFVDCEITVWEA